MPIIPGISELKDVVSVLGHFPSQLAKVTADPRTVRLPAGTRRGRVQKRAFISHAADGQLRVVLIDKIVDLLCHFTGNKITSYFWKCYS